MTDMTWKPLSQLDNFSDRTCPSLISAPGLKWPSTAPDKWPQIHSVEKQKEFRIIAKLPDLKTTDIQLHVQDDVLEINCIRKTATNSKSKKFSVLRTWRFSRFFSLPQKVNQTAIKAHFKKQVLTIRLPKSKKPAQMNSAIKVN